MVAAEAVVAEAPVAAVSDADAEAATVEPVVEPALPSDRGLDPDEPPHPLTTVATAATDAHKATRPTDMRVPLPRI